MVRGSQPKKVSRAATERVVGLLILYQKVKRFIFISSKTFSFPNSAVIFERQWLFLVYNLCMRPVIESPLLNSGRSRSQNEVSLIEKHQARKHKAVCRSSLVAFVSTTSKQKYDTKYVV